MIALEVAPEVPAPTVGTGARLTVDLDAVAANVRLLAARSPRLMAVVKADGFGHGSAALASTAVANGATSLGVTSVAEALELRAAGLTEPILSWLNPVDADFGSAVRAGVEIAVPSLEILAAVEAIGGARVHLYLDCGLARDGVPPALWQQVCLAARRAERQGRLRVVGVMGHLACADRPGDPANALGRTRFAWGVEVARAAGLRPTQRHLAATASVLTDPLSHHTMCRVGAGLVGIDPSGSTRLRAALTLTAPLVSLRAVRPGTGVGYGHTHLTSRPTQLALLPLGYADGLPRSASHLAEVSIRGRRCRVVGRISMDQTVVDVGEMSVAPGDVATVFGPGDDGEPTTADWARWAGTIEHEIVTGIGARVNRSVTQSLRSVS